MRILIVKTSSLGDIVHAFPILQYLKQYQPQCQIDWVVEQTFIDLVQSHPLVSRAIPIQVKKWRSQFLRKITWQEITQFFRELRKRPYQMVLDLQGNSKSGLITALAKSQIKVGFNYASVSEWPNLLGTNRKYPLIPNKNIREDYLFLAKSAFGDFTQEMAFTHVQLNLSTAEKAQLNKILNKNKEYEGLKFLICLGSNWPNKQLSKETLQIFLQCISERLSVHFLFLWGNLAEKVAIEELTFALSASHSILDRLSLPTLQNLMTHMDLVFAMDSLPLHLAGLTMTPTYSVFGASSAMKYKPLGKHHEAFQGICPYGKTFGKRCPVLRTCPTGACIKQIGGLQLFEHFYSWWLSLSRK